MSEGSSAPEIKISKNPEIQAKVDQRSQELSTSPKFAKRPDALINEKARSEVAHSIWRNRLRKIIGRERQGRATAEENAMIEPVTGLRTRKWFDEQLEIAIRKAERRQVEVAKALAEGRQVDQTDDGTFWMELDDLDDFKAFNTHYTWDGGDEALRSLAAPETRPGEERARYGGDEFAQLINSNITDEQVIELSQRNALTVKEDSRRRLSALTPTGRPGTPPSEVTLSSGLVKYQRGMKAEDLRALANRATALAKETKDTLVVCRDGVNLELVIPKPAPESTSPEAVAI